MFILNNPDPSKLTYTSPEFKHNKTPTLPNLALSALAENSPFSLPPPAQITISQSVEDQLRFTEMFIAQMKQKKNPIIEDVADKNSYSCLNCIIC